MSAERWAASTIPLLASNRGALNISTERRRGFSAALWYILIVLSAVLLAAAISYLLKKVGV